MRGALPYGKLQPDVLQRVLGAHGAQLPEVALGPGFGIDFAAIRVGGGYLIVSADPITGAAARVGWHAVNVSANDVATSGVRPRYLEVVVLHPLGATPRSVLATATDIDAAAKKLEIAVVGGHTEVTPGLDRVAVSATAFGFGQHYVTAADARAGDVIVMTKTAGLEGTSLLATQFAEKLRLPHKILRRARRMREKLSVVRDATTAFATGAVHAMHDSTEGGVIGALYEMARAADLGFILDLEAVPVADDTRAICEALGADPLRLISSGVLLAAAARSESEQVLGVLRKAAIPAAVIGSFTSGRMLVRTRDDRTIRHRGPIHDELWRLLGRQAQARTRSMRSNDAFRNA